MKRARTVTVVSPRAKRPIDKQVISINQSVTAAQASTLLWTVGTPGTVVGIRWSLTWVQNDDALSSMSWVIVVVRDGQTASTLVLTDGSSLYQPEQDVLVFGSAAAPATSSTGGPLSRFFEGQSGGTRTLRDGDELRLVSLGGAGSDGFLVGAVQFFIKS